MVLADDVSAKGLDETVDQMVFLLKSKTSPVQFFHPEQMQTMHSYAAARLCLIISRQNTEHSPPAAILKPIRSVYMF